MRLAVVRFPLQCRLEVRFRRLRLMQIMEHVTAIDVCGHYVGIAVQSLGKIQPRLIELSLMLVYITGQQRNVRLFGKDLVLLRGQLLQLVVSCQVQQIVAEIHHHVAVVRQHLDDLLAHVRRLLILPAKLRYRSCSRSTCGSSCIALVIRPDHSPATSSVCASIAAFIPPATISALSGASAYALL